MKNTLRITLSSFLFSVPINVASAESSEQKTLIGLQKLRQALAVYYDHLHHFPTAAQGLAALWKNPSEPGWQGPYAFERDGSVDAWGYPLKYLCGGAEAALFSMGRDGKWGTNDDDVAVLVTPFAEQRQ